MYIVFFEALGENHYGGTSDRVLFKRGIRGWGGKTNGG